MQWPLHLKLLFVCNFSPALTILFRNKVFVFFRIECNLPQFHLSHFNMHVLLYEYLYLHDHGVSPALSSGHL